MYNIVLEVPMLQRAQHNSIIDFCIFLIDPGDYKFETESEHVSAPPHSRLTHTA